MFGGVFFLCPEEIESTQGACKLFSSSICFTTHEKKKKKLIFPLFSYPDLLFFLWDPRTRLFFFFVFCWCDSGGTDNPRGEPRRTVSGYIKICGAPSGNDGESV